MQVLENKWVETDFRVSVEELFFLTTAVSNVHLHVLWFNYKHT
jgi:hypothetical protein